MIKKLFAKCNIPWKSEYENMSYKELHKIMTQSESYIKNRNSEYTIRRLKHLLK